MKLGEDKWAVVALGAVLLIFVAILVFAKGLVSVTDSGRHVSLEYGENGLQGVVRAGGEVQQQLRAQVKGSIYMPGETVSVYGTCLNSTDGGFPNTYGTLSAWYPNGTVFFTDSAMQQIQTGYFLYMQQLSPSLGTYLTEFTCHVNGTDIVAKSFGEWQFPEWVKRINDTYNAVGELNTTIVYNQNQTSGWFNMTWNIINESIANINITSANYTDQFTYVAYVANASVDRNDSYLAQLLLSIAYTVQAPVTGVLYIEDVSQSPRYRSNWRIEVQVRNEYNQTVGEPIVHCYLNHTNSVPVTNAMMYYWETNQAKLFPDKRTKIFYWDEFVDRLGEFNWSYSCRYDTNVFIPS